MYMNDSASLKCFLLKCPESKKSKFNVSEVALLVSVGKLYHEGEKLWATINFINKEFKKCHIMVNDSLQRHSIILYEDKNIPLNEAYKKSLQEGQKWLERNSQFLKSFTIPFEVYHWDYWLKKKEYVINRSEIDNLYARDLNFKEAMNISINEFLLRNQGEVKSTGLERAYNLCLEYLLEEIAVIMGVWRDYNYHFVLYPGKIIEVLKCAHLKLVNDGMLYWLHVKFRRNNKRLYREKTREASVCT